VNPQARAELTTNMIRLADGDRQAFEPIFEATWPLAHRLAIRTLGSTPEAEDVAQHALMKVFSRATEFRADGDALSWILGITSYECKTARNKTLRRREEFDKDETIEQAALGVPTAEEQLLHRDMDRGLEEVLHELSPQERETILIAIHDLERPNIPAATFRKRLQRAMDRLREKWSEKNE
jgi:RNA polymerase sigma-70 factor, ECF subfamily